MTLTSDGRGRPMYGPLHADDCNTGWPHLNWSHSGAAPVGGTMRRSLLSWRSRLNLLGWSLLATSIGSLVLGPPDHSWAALGILVAAAPFAARHLLSSGFRCPRCTAAIDWRHEATHCDRCASPLP